MPRSLPPASDPANPETIEEHLRIGRRWIAEARVVHPGLPIEDAIVLYLEGGKLDPSTVARYRADYKYALNEHMRAAGQISEFPAAWEKVNTALTARKARIPKSKRRTSALKVKDATEEEARALFYELKRHALKHGNPNAILAALFALVAGHTGFRPIEMRGAEVVGTMLVLPNAKKRPGHERIRELNLADVHDDVLKGLHLMLDLIDHDLSKREFAKWEKVLAGQIRRACIRLGIRKLCPYAFRHVAIATWSAAGLPPEEIARLCGHLSIRTAHTHYARAAKGHKRTAVARAVPATPEPSLSGDADIHHPVEPPVTDNNSEPHGVGERVDKAFFEDIPKPVYKKDNKSVALDGVEVMRHFERLVDDRNSHLIASNIAKARLGKKSGGALRKSGDLDPKRKC